MLIYNPPHGKIRVHPCAKNIHAIRVQRKNSIRVPKTFVLFAIRVQRKIRVHLCVPKTSIDLIHAYIYFMSFLRP